MLTVAPVGKKQANMPTQQTFNGSNNQDIADIQGSERVSEQMNSFTAPTPIRNTFSGGGTGRNDATNILGHVYVGQAKT